MHSISNLLEWKEEFKDSVANVSQIITIDKSYLTEKAGQISAASLKKIDEGLRLVLSISSLP